MPQIEEIPDKDQLELEQLWLTNAKLKIETEKLRTEAIPEKWWSKLIKNAIAAGGVVTILATVYGLWDSYRKTIDERARTQSVERRTQFEEAIKKLESKSTISKLVGVSVLSGYLTPNDRSFHRQILFTLASLVATERDPQTQAAVLDLMTAQDNRSIAPEDWLYFQSMLVSQSRALMRKDDLYRKRNFADVTSFEEEPSARHVGNLIAVNVRKGVVPSYQDYRSIYCEGCSFRSGVFPKGTDFTASVLDHADFRGASLEEASFDNADMGGTVFSEAYLRNSNFRTLSVNRLNATATKDVPDGKGVRFFTPFLQHVQGYLQSADHVAITMPDFSCANLANAHFDNFALFVIPPASTRTFNKGDEKKGGWQATVSDNLRKIAEAQGSVEITALSTTPPSFYKADLEGTHFENIRYFSGSHPKSGSYFETAMASGNSENPIWEGLARPDLFATPPLGPDGAPKPIMAGDDFAEDREEFQVGLKWAFFHSVTDKAVLPSGVANILKSPFPPGFDERRGFLAVFRTNGELDWNCAPRTIP